MMRKRTTKKEDNLITIVRAASAQLDRVTELFEQAVSNARDGGATLREIGEASHRSHQTIQNVLDRREIAMHEAEASCG